MPIPKNPEHLALVDKIKKYHKKLKDPKQYHNFAKVIAFNKEIENYLNSGKISLQEIGLKHHSDLLDILISVEKSIAPKTFYHYAEELKVLIKDGRPPNKEEKEKLFSLKNCINHGVAQLPEQSPCLLTNRELKALLKNL